MLLLLLLFSSLYFYIYLQIYFYQFIIFNLTLLAIINELQYYQFIEKINQNSIYNYFNQKINNGKNYIFKFVFYDEDDKFLDNLLLKYK